ncbi:MAG: hypothetical protein M3041_13250 [Acidobacteriota bacterium]|nr:hypothetical protein [Acidobacteriota bacterium]
MTWRIGLFLLIWATLLAPLIVPVKRPSQVYLEFASAITIFAAAAIVRRGIERRPVVSLGFHPQHLARDLSAGLLIGSATMATCAGFVGFAICGSRSRFTSHGTFCRVRFLDSPSRGGCRLLSLLFSESRL